MPIPDAVCEARDSVAAWECPDFWQADTSLQMYRLSVQERLSVDFPVARQISREACRSVSATGTPSARA